MCFDMEKYVYSESTSNTLYIEIKHKYYKRFPLDKISDTKMPSFFFCELQLITVFLLICKSYMS